MNFTLRYSNGISEDYSTFRSAMLAALEKYPDGYAVDAGGSVVDSDMQDVEYDVRLSRVAMIWENEEDSENDDGANAVATISKSN